MVISIHKALAGLDGREPGHQEQSGIFQSTRPSRASTAGEYIQRWGYPYFNPQGPRGPRQRRVCDYILDGRFQSTRPSRASTMVVKSYEDNDTISIHKALAGLDHTGCIYPESGNYFNPQGPRGPRRNV